MFKLKKDKKYYTWKPVKKLAFILVILLTGQSLLAQEFSISGRITDAANGEDLIGVTVVENGTTIGTTTNVYGFYSLTLPSGLHTITFSFIGFEPQTMNVNFNENKSIHVRLSDTNTELEEVVVTAGRKDENITSTRMSVEKLNMKQIETIPVFMGEKDVLKTIQLLPGISTTS
jgi:hypothetical protein